MWSGFRAGLLTGVMIVVAGLATSSPARAQISDQSVKWYIDFVWNNLGAQFSDRDGSVVRIDKTKKDEVVVPLDVARHVIVGGWRGARTRICDLPEEFNANFEITRATSNRMGTWSSQQRHFMKALFQRVVQLNSGNTKVVVREDGKVVEEKTVKSKVIKDCTDEERESLRKEIKAMVAKDSAENPDGAKAAVAAGAAKPAEGGAAAPAP